MSIPSISPAGQPFAPRWPRRWRVQRRRPAPPRLRSLSPVVVLPPGLPDLRRRYEALRRDWVLNDRLIRPDGYVYTIDWGQLLIYFAVAGDRDLYLRMQDHVVRHLLVNDVGEALTQGFVLWRFKPGEPRHASGTTEMLRVAKALWHGAASSIVRRTRNSHCSFSAATPATRPLTRASGWSATTTTLASGISRPTRSSSITTPISSPRSRPRKNAELRDTAEKCYGVYRKALAPSGLVYDLVQPEIKTLVGRRDVLFFSPNDIMGLHNSVTCPQGVARGLPHIAKGVLGFALARMADLRAYYFGRTGEPVDDAPATVFELNSLLRLAMLCGGAVARQQCLKRVLPLWQEYEQRAKPTEAYTVSEVLLTMQALMERKA